ncbi:hypothetical protein LX36DRAFT_664544, partial [Colletotrichum falcatum]
MLWGFNVDVLGLSRPARTYPAVPVPRGHCCAPAQTRTIVCLSVCLSVWLRCLALRCVPPSHHVRTRRILEPASTQQRH